MNGLNWAWIVAMLTAPPMGALIVAVPLWRRSQVILGNIAATIVIFGSALALIMREHVELDRLVQACLDAGTTCWPDPSAFTRYAVYAWIGLFEVFGVFALSLIVERRIRNRRYAPEWR